MEGIQNPGVMTPTGLKFGKIVVSLMPLPCCSQLQSDDYNFECSLSPNLMEEKSMGKSAGSQKSFLLPLLFFFLHTHGYSVSLFYWRNIPKAMTQGLEVLSTNLINLWKGGRKRRTCRFVCIDSPDLFCVKSLLHIIFTSTVFFSI